MAYEPLHHKYRPQTFAELVGQEAIASTLTNALRQQKIAPAYLFTGARGTGKTSSARILAKSLNCLSSQVPTEQPCGVCEVCRAIAKGAALDVIEIDAASNTGVDNIRELIERSQFAPVQARYKVYVVDECLTGDALVLTNDGLLRIDDPAIQKKKVLSYNDASGAWESKQVLRWLDQGVRQTFVIKTTNRIIKCTGNHLVRTIQGWIPARDLKPGMKILSPQAVYLNLPRQPEKQPLKPRDLWLNKVPISCGVGILPAPQEIEKIGILDSTQYPQWTTNFEEVESITLGKLERVYDIEVEDNHNFVANGLTVHNCHMLSTAAFNALLKTLEEPPDRVVFVLATTDPQRVLPTIISRCQRFDFRRIPLEAMVKHLGLIATQEAIAITPEAIQLVGQISQGGLRDAESLLDQLSLLEGQVTSDRVWDLVGAVPERDLLALVQAIANDDPTTVIDQARHLMDRGREPLTVLQNLASFYRDLLIAKATPDRLDLVAITPPTWAELCQFAQRLDIATILMGQQRLRESEVQVRNTTQPRLWLEVTLMGLLPSATATTLAPAARVTKPPEHQPIKPQASPAQHPTEPIAKPSQPPAIATSAAPEAPHQNGNGQHKNGQENGQSLPVSLLSSEDIGDRSFTSPNSPEPQISAPVVQSGFDLVQVWNELIANLQPPGTQMLLRQQGRLIAFNGQEAKVGFTSQPLFKMAIERGPNIEAAFAKIYGHKIRISLEVVASKEGQATAAQPAASEERSPSPPASPAARESAAEFKATPPTQPLPECTAQPSSPTTQTAAQPTLEPNLAAWQTEDEVSRAAKSLAQMFNGQIVSSDSPALPGLATAELSPNPEVDLSNEPDGEAEDDEDVPF